MLFQELLERKKRRGGHKVFRKREHGKSMTDKRTRKQSRTKWYRRERKRAAPHILGRVPEEKEDKSNKRNR